MPDDDVRHPQRRRRASRGTGDPTWIAASTGNDASKVSEGCIAVAASSPGAGTNSREGDAARKLGRAIDEHPEPHSEREQVDDRRHDARDPAVPRQMTAVLREEELERDGARGRTRLIGRSPADERGGVWGTGRFPTLAQEEGGTRGNMVSPANASRRASVAHSIRLRPVKVQEDVLERVHTDEDALGDEPALMQRVRGGVAVVGVEEDAVRQRLDARHLQPSIQWLKSSGRFESKRGSHDLARRVVAGSARRGEPSATIFPLSMTTAVAKAARPRPCSGS